MSPPRIPTATYRLQFSRDFTFRDATRLVPYLDALGISHLYASPFLKARAGSPHGYDITDYNALNPEIGDEADLDALVAALHRHGMGLILDFVPNHMGVGRADNAWWLDVLEWGRASPYAGYFDIAWEAAKPNLEGKLLLPVLGDHYGAVLVAGELVPAFDGEAGSFSIWYHEHRFPLTPPSYGVLFAAAGDDPAIAAIAAEFRKLRPAETEPARGEMRARADDLKAQLAHAAADAAVRAAIDRALSRLGGVKGDPSSFVPLHRLLEGQQYRLAYWRVAADEINYRRFFDINELAGVRMENAEVFATAHRLVLRLVAEGKIDGLRIDHIDGLFDPEEYCRRLAAALEEAAPAREAPYLVVEKILARHETLRRDWPIAGTTGYDALNLINGVFVDRRAERAFSRLYRRFVGRAPDIETVIYDAKRLVMDTLLAGELEVLAAELDRISEANWQTRDFTLASLRAALRDVIACFPVYRTYVTERGATAEDRRDIDWAVAQARRRSAAREATIFDFVHDALTTDLVRRPPEVFQRRAVIAFAMKFQQLTGPVTAKSVEDTAFYRHTRLLSLNEVGGDPGRFGVTRAAFHHLNRERARYWPRTMIATATHDTKRGEDARARLNVLSEFPAEWGLRLRRWSTLNRHAKAEVEGEPAPSPDDEFLLYQTLIGAWPMAFLGTAEPSGAPLDDFRGRIGRYMLKAVREAKLISNWAAPNAAYEAALTGFVDRLLDPARSHAFLGDLQGFATRIALPGMINALAQLVLKLTIPGVPDCYQGSECWDLNLVDPDNRRAVDFALRDAALAGLPRPEASPGERAAAAAALLAQWPDGRIKLFLLATLLAARRRHAALFDEGAYLPLATRGPAARQLIAFARVAGEAAVAVVVPRLVVSLGAGAGRMPVGEAWADSTILCPPALGSRRWMNLVTGEDVQLKGEGTDQVWRVGTLLATLPVAALIAEGE